jgi:hypothetical protein
MTSTDRLDPLTFAGSFAYLESDLPPGLTLPAWRSQRSGSASPASSTSDEAAAGADLAPQGRTPLGVRMRARRPRSGRGPGPRRNQ